MSPPERRLRSKLHRELEPHILPRQLRALEHVASRLIDARPAPDPGFRKALGEQVEMLNGGAAEDPTRSWLFPAVAAVGLGLALLVVAAALAL